MSSRKRSNPVKTKMEIARKGHLDIDRDFYIVYSTEHNKLSGAQKKPEWDICCIRLFP